MPGKPQKLKQLRVSLWGSGQDITKLIDTMRKAIGGSKTSEKDWFPKEAGEVPEGKTREAKLPNFKLNVPLSWKEVDPTYFTTAVTKSFIIPGWGNRRMQR